MRKKLFAVIMSIMMMVTFMPAMAFAASCNHAEGKVKFNGWSKDYSEAYFKVVCTNEECTTPGGATLGTFSVATVRLFDIAKKDGQSVFNENLNNIESVKTNAGIKQEMKGAIYAYATYEAVMDAAEKLDDKKAWDLADGYMPDAKYTKGGDDKGIFLTSYYDFKNAVLCDADGVAWSKMDADTYLDGTNFNHLLLTEPADIDSFDKKANTAVVTLTRYTNDKTSYYATQLYNTEELFDSSANSTKHMSSNANRDVRLDVTAPQYAPYEDNVTLDVPFKLRAYADIEDDFDVRIVNLTEENTQKIAITTNTDDLTLDHYIYNVKGEVVPEASGSAEKINVKKFTKVFDNESAAKRAVDSQRTVGPTVAYVGEDVCFEVATKNVTVQYGAIDQVGNVTWSDTAPVIKDVKYEKEGFYNDTYYHFLVKVTKGSKTVYAHVQMNVKPAILDIGFNQNAFVFGKGEEVDKKDLLGYGVIETSTLLGFKKVPVYAADKALVDQLVDKYVTVENINTDKLGERVITISLDKAAATKDATKADESVLQFNANYKIAVAEEDLIEELVNKFTANRTRAEDYVNEAVQAIKYMKVMYPKTASFTVSDVSNQIRISNKIKTFHVKKAAKLKATKKFQLKAKANYGKVTFKKVTAKYAKITISKTGKVTVKKGLKKGTYKVKFKAFAPNKTVTRTMVIKIKK